MRVFTTGSIARQMNLSRERIIQVLDEAGLEVQRNAFGHRVLTAQDVARLRAFRRRRGRVGRKRRKVEAANGER